MELDFEADTSSQKERRKAKAPDESPEQLLRRLKKQAQTGVVSINTKDALKPELNDKGSSNRDLRATLRSLSTLQNWIVKDWHSMELTHM